LAPLTEMRFLRVLWAFLVVTACQDAAAPQRSRIAHVEIAERALRLPILDEVQMHAVARAVSFAVIDSVELTWSTSAPSILNVTPGGYVTVVDVPSNDISDSVSVAWVKARAPGGATDSVAIRVCRFMGGETGQRLQVALWNGALHRRFILGSTAVLYDGQAVALSGGLAVATPNGAAISSRVFFRLDAGRIPGSFDNVSMCQFETPFGEYTRTILAAGDSAGALPLRIEQETFVADIIANGGALLLKYTLTNRSSRTLAGVRLGFPMTWDLWLNPNTPHLNRTRYNGALGAAEAYLPGFETAGIAAILTPPTSYRGWYFTGSFLQSANDIYPRLAEGIVEETAMSTQPGGDIGNMLGFGPYDFAPGQTHSLTVVITAGFTREEFASNVQAARTVADDFPGLIRAQN
jgi:hypothetical protein